MAQRVIEGDLPHDGVCMSHTVCDFDKITKNNKIIIFNMRSPLESRYLRHCDTRPGFAHVTCPM